MAGAAAVDDDQMRSEIRTLLDGADLAALSIGKLRGMLEKRLGLSAGSLEPRKDHVNALLKEELTSFISQDGGNKRKAETDGGPAEKKPAVSTATEAVVEEPPVPDAEGAAVEEAPEAPPAVKTPKTPEDEAPLVPVEALATAEKEASLPGTMAVSGSEDGTLRLWDLDAYVCMHGLHGHDEPVRCVDAHWGEMIAVSGADDGARLWDLRQGTCTRNFECVADGCASILGDWDRQRAFGGCMDGRLRVWNFGDSKEDDALAGKGPTLAHLRGVWALAADWKQGKLVSAGDLEVKIWSIEDLECLTKISGHPGGIMSLAVDMENLRILVGTGERSGVNLKLWNTENSKMVQSFGGNQGAVSQIKADWDDDVAVSGDWDGTLRVWNVAKGTCSHRHDTRFGRVHCMGVDFKRMHALCGSSKGELHLVDLRTGAALRTLEGHVGSVTSLCAKFP